MEHAIPVNETPQDSEVVEEERERLSHLIVRIFDSKRGEISIGTLMKELDHHGIALVLIVFSFPAALPLPAPGYSTLLSIPLLFIGIGLLLGKSAIIFPEFVSKRKFDLAKFSKVTKLMERIALFLETISKPRLRPLVQSQISKSIIGVLICLLGLSMAIPIPGTNTLPAGGIFLIGFSFLEDDALFLMIGALWSLIALCFTVLIIYFGTEAVKFFIKGILGISSSTEEIAAIFQSGLPIIG